MIIIKKNTAEIWQSWTPGIADQRYMVRMQLKAETPVQSATLGHQFVQLDFTDAFCGGEVKQFLTTIEMT